MIVEIQLLAPRTVTIQDNTLPVINCPAAVTVECNATTPDAGTGNATAIDNCSGVLSMGNDITYMDNDSPSGRIKLSGFFLCHNTYMESGR